MSQFPACIPRKSSKYKGLRQKGIPCRGRRIVFLSPLYNLLYLLKTSQTQCLRVSNEPCADRMNVGDESLLSIEHISGWMHTANAATVSNRKAITNLSAWLIVHDPAFPCGSQQISLSGCLRLSSHNFLYFFSEVSQNLSQFSKVGTP